jgi:hypothetical protein
MAMTDMAARANGALRTGSLTAYDREGGEADNIILFKCSGSRRLIGSNLRRYPVNEFTVIDCRVETEAASLIVKARTPEEAALLALGEPVARGGHHRNLICRVYWHYEGQKNMVRLYTKAA